MNAEDAFINSKERNVFVATAPAQQLLDTLEQGLAHASPIVVLTGDAGLGKSTTMREAAARWGDRVHVAWLDAARVPLSELFGQTIRRFGGHFRASDQRPEQVGRFAVALNAVHTRNLTPVLVVDDAHELSLPALAELGRIESAAAATNVPFKLVLLGRPALLDRLNDESLQPLVTRIAVRGTIEPMGPNDTREYLAHRVAAAGGDDSHGFSKKAAREIHNASNGVPTLVNALSDEAQRCAHASGTAMVGPEHVRAVIAAAYRTEPAPEPEPEPTPAPTPVADAKPPGKERRKAKPAIPEKPKVIKEHKAATTPASAAAHTPPPTPRPAAPLPPMSDLDSASPRVRDWVSRFTDGQPPIRFGARVTPPARETSKAFDPDLVPPPTEVQPQELEPAKDELAAAVEPPAPFVERRRSPRDPSPAAAEPVANEDAREAKVAAPEPRADEAAVAAEEKEVEAEKPEEPKLVIENGHDVPPPAPHLEIVGVSPEEDVVVAEAKPVPLEVKPEQLASPPLKLDEAPAPYTPEPKAERAAPVAPDAPVARSAPKDLEPAAKPSAPVREPVVAKAPIVPASDRPFAPPQPLTAADVKPVQSKKERAAARRADRAARRAADAAARAEEARKRTAEAAARTAEAAARAKAAAASTPAVAPAAKPVVAAPKSAPRTSSAPVLGAPSATTIATVLPREVESQGDGPRSPRHSRAVIGIVTGALLLVGMAIAAVLLMRRGGLGAGNEDTAVATAPEQVEPAPNPVTTTPVPPAPVPVPTPDTAADAKREPANVSDDEPVVDRSEAGRWCLVVGSYLYEDRAKQIANKLIKRTKQTVRVVPDGRGAEKAYRIFYGSYATESAAVRAADRLLARGIVTEAMVERNPD